MPVVLGPRALSPSSGTASKPTLPTFGAPTAGVVTRFQASHGFVIELSATGNANDLDCVMGTQSMRFSTLGDGVQGRAKNYALPALNTTGKQIRVLLRINRLDKLNRIALYLGDTNMTNCWNWVLQRGNADFTSCFCQPWEWAVVTLNWQDASVTGAPNRAAVTCCTIAAYDNNTGTPVEVQVQAIDLIDESPLFPNGVVTLSFDDSYASVFTEAKLEMDKYGFPGTVFNIVGLVGQAGRATLDQIQKSQNYAGWEHGAHALTNANHSARFPNLSLSALEADFQGQLAWAKTNGIAMDGVAWPGGNFNSAIMTLAKRYFKYARTIIKEPMETVPFADPFKLRAVSSISSYAGGVTAATVGTLVEKAKANKAWLNLVFHDIVTSAPTATSQCSRADFNTICAKLSSEGVQVLTARDVVKKVMG